MDRPLLMGIDLGGGGARCIVTDPQDGRCTVASRAWSFPPFPHPSGLA